MQLAIFRDVPLSQGAVMTREERKLWAIYTLVARNGAPSVWLVVPIPDWSTKRVRLDEENWRLYYNPAWLRRVDVWKAVDTIYELLRPHLG
jgi:hypothetical protein